MDWSVAVERNREGLKRILALLIAMAGLADGVDATTLPRRLHRSILRLVRPAEAAVRRLVIVIAQGLVATLPSPRPAKANPKPNSIFVRNGVGTGIILPPGVRPADVMTSIRAKPSVRSLSFPLLDPLRLSRRERPVAHSVPRICRPGVTAPFLITVRRPPSSDDPVNAKRLALRLKILGRVLDDLPRQARRMARWLARCNARLTRRLWPLRPGRPAGGRKRRTHEIDHILSETHSMAFDVLERRDTS